DFRNGLLWRPSQRDRFFFSSRRRHTRSDRDWSSDVCSSDLLVHFQAQLQAMPEFNLPIIREIQNALVEVRPLVDVGSSHISPDSVRKISEITNRLDSGIVTRD